LRIWALYVPTSIITFGGCVLLYENLKGGEFWESEIFLGGSSAASLTISYFVLNNKEKNSFPKSILTNSEKEIYKQAYSKKLRQRKFNEYKKGAAVTCIFTVVIVAVALATWEMSGFDMGPQPPGPY